MQINAAWEVLGDEVKRKEYDVTHLRPGAAETNPPKPQSTTTPKPNRRSTTPSPSPQPSTQKNNPPKTQPEPEPKTTPKPSYQPPSTPQPETTAQEEARAETLSNILRKEWLDFEKHQEDWIRGIQADIKSFERIIVRFRREITRFQSKLKKIRVRLMTKPSYRCRDLDEEEANDLRGWRTTAEHQIKLCQSDIEQRKKRIQQLKEELAKRRYEEYVRLSDEKWRLDKARLAKERIRRAKKAEAAEAARETAARKDKKERHERKQRQRARAEEERL